MQYSKCMQCRHNGEKCKFVMAKTMALCHYLEDVVNYAQNHQSSYCTINISYSCENFIPKEEEKNV